MWTARYEELQSKAKTEDYVRRHLEKHGPPMPIWIACEFLDFGALARLYELLDRKDQNAVAEECGVGPNGGRLLAGWLKGLNYLRNTAAHHSRMWNRTLTYKFTMPNGPRVHPALAHVQSLDPAKIYVSLAILAYLNRHIDPGTRWPTKLRDDVKKFPQLPYLSVSDMAFPSEWEVLDLWSHEPLPQAER